MFPRHRFRSVLVPAALALAACSGGTAAEQASEPAGALVAQEETGDAATDRDVEADTVRDLERAEAQARRAAKEAARAAEARRQAEAEAERAEEQARQEAEAEARRQAEEEAARRVEERTEVQRVLAEHGYYDGPVDGEVGPATSSAVMAFQKVHGLSRDGAIGPETVGAAEAPQSPPLVGGAATRIEVDLDRQVVHLVRDGARVRTMNASSGNGEVYTWPDGRVARADTPVGTFTIQRRVEGLRDGDLGAMYDPLYFHEGWAIHGSNSVPGHAASHGCVRLSRADGRWLAGQVPDGTQVLVHGSVNAFDPSTESVWL